jgi:hypothetical protein
MLGNSFIIGFSFVLNHIRTRILRKASDRQCRCTSNRTSIATKTDALTDDTDHKPLVFITVAGLVSTAQGCGGDDHAAIFLPVPE